MPNILARITLKKTSEGGRTMPIVSLRDFGCPLFFSNTQGLQDHSYDCRLLIQKLGTQISPGETVNNIPIAFLSPDDVLPHLKVGTHFELWEGKIIGEGEIVAIREKP